jgi:hypothetical protein
MYMFCLQKLLYLILQHNGITHFKKKWKDVNEIMELSLYAA